MSESSNSKPLVLIGLLAVIALVGFGVFKMQSGPEGAAVGWSTIDDARKFSPGLGGFPSPNAVNVPLLWDGNEVPQPAPPPNGYPSGPVITLQAIGAELVSDKAYVTVDGSEEEIPSTILHKGNDEGMPYDTVALIPHAPLQPLTTYRVRVVGARDGLGFDESWTFTTRSESCDPVAQDCGIGQGCYVVQGEAQCLWTGAVPLDGVCRFANACAPGLTCFGSRCRPYCDKSEASDPELACESHCPHGVAAMGDTPELAGLGICHARPCVEDGATCGDKEGCYLAGGWMCNWAGEASRGETCAASNDCAAGLSCFGTGDGAFQCHTMCNGAGLPDCDAACTNGHRAVGPDTAVRYCKQ